MASSPTERGIAVHAATAPAASGAPARSPAWERLEDQLGWYERNSAHCKR